MVQEFKKKKENILALFETAKMELETLNSEIAVERKSNADKIAQLQLEQKELETLSVSNKKSISALSAFVGK